MSRPLYALLAALFAFGTAAPAAATLADLVIDFDSFVDGEIVADGTMLFADWSLSVENPNRDFSPNFSDLAVAFDSDASGSTSDGDLRRNSGWAGGNLVTNALFDDILGKVLILQENDSGCGDGICDNPDDEGSRTPRAGSFTFDLLGKVFASISFVLVDVEGALDEMGSITFFRGSEEQVFDFSQFLVGDFASLDVVFGNRTANRIPIDLTDFGGFDSFKVELGGSSAIDGIELIELVPIPEPTTALLFALGLGGIAVSGSRRRR